MKCWLSSLSNPALQPTDYSELRPLPPSAELERFEHKNLHSNFEQRKKAFLLFRSVGVWRKLFLPMTVTGFTGRTRIRPHI